MKFEKEFRKDCPETIGETDHAFDLYNYSEWLEKKVEKLKDILSVKPPNKVDSVCANCGTEPLFKSNKHCNSCGATLKLAQD